MYLLLVNPKSGNNHYARIEHSLKAGLDRDGVKYRIVTIEDLADIPELLKNTVRDNTKGVVAVGGNGTVASVIDALASYNLPLAIIPTSKTNHLSHMLGVRNWQAGLKLLSKHTVQDKCLGKIGERYFIGKLTIAPKRNLLTGVLDKPSWARRFLGPNFARGLSKLQSVASTIKLAGNLVVTCQVSSIDIELTNHTKKKIKVVAHTPNGNGSGDSVFHTTTLEITSSLNMPILSGNETIANTPAKIRAIESTMQFLGPVTQKVPETKTI